MRLVVTLLAILSCAPACAERYDVVLEGGWVIDPETGLEAIRNVGIHQDRIARVTTEPLEGRRVVDAKGLVVAPGFIDLHQHAQEEAAGRLKAFDGVTTALELEIGAADMQSFLGRKRGHSLINFGASASHGAARALTFGAPIPEGTIIPAAGPATNLPATSAQLRQIEDRLRTEIDAGGLGVGMGIQYTPGATRLEVIRMFAVAAERRVPVFTHIRSSGQQEPGSSIEAVSEVIGAAAVTGASLHIVHINSSCLRDAPECLGLIAGARARGLDVTTEGYPYVAGMTYINSAFFNPGWQEKLNIDYSGLQLPETGERLTKERFDELRSAGKPRRVLEFINTQDNVDAVITHPLVIIASDGELAHPRAAGTYSLILARYVRRLRTLTLMDAIRKMSLMPAQRLEKATPAARRKGRLQEGADADIVVFDPETVSDRSTYEKPDETSTGMRYVIVGGVVLIDDGKLRAGTFPGKALTSTRMGAGQ